MLDFYISIKSPRKFKKAVAVVTLITNGARLFTSCLLYTSPSPRDYAASRMPSSA
ncbi:hypothetical protein JMUB7518_27990 [Staphylococcus aureus]